MIPSACGPLVSGGRAIVARIRCTVDDIPVTHILVRPERQPTIPEKHAIAIRHLAQMEGFEP